MKTTIAILAVSALSALVASPAVAGGGRIFWRGDFSTGEASLHGNCDFGKNQWCRPQVVRPGQIKVVKDPVTHDRNVARFEVQYGDVFPGMSDSRSVITPPAQLWEDEGSERWYAWQWLFPTDFVGDYPKWDELDNPTAHSSAGAMVQWHHDGNGQAEHGSAPLYIGSDNKHITICLVNQATSECRIRKSLTPLIRGRWMGFILHAKWSSDPSVGFLEMWIDGKLVLPKFATANKYPGMRNYLAAGLYRNGHIGDPNMMHHGSAVYGPSGTPGVMYMANFVAADNAASVAAAGAGGKTQLETLLSTEGGESALKTSLKKSAPQNSPATPNSAAVSLSGGAAGESESDAVGSNDPVGGPDVGAQAQTEAESLSAPSALLNRPARTLANKSSPNMMVLESESENPENVERRAKGPEIVAPATSNLSYITSSAAPVAAKKASAADLKPTKPEPVAKPDLKKTEVSLELIFDGATKDGTAEVESQKQ